MGAAFLLALTACSTSEPWRGSRAAMVAWASERDFTASELDAGQFKLLALTRQRNPACQTMSVYIEGDGAPWVTPWQAPRDPTPLTPTALLMAAVDPAGAVAYFKATGEGWQSRMDGVLRQYVQAHAVPKDR